LFTDYCEAEAHIVFGEVIKDGKVYMGCTGAKIQQAKTAYNREIPSSDKSELNKVIRAFKRLPMEFFNPQSKLNTDEPFPKPC
jgi:hypothetical protein